MRFCLLILLLGASAPRRATGSDFGDSPNIIITINNKKLNNVRAVSLNLSGLQIESIEETALDSFSQLEHLDLANNKLQTIPKLILPKLTNLRSLSLANNDITSLDGAFAGLRSLQQLNVSNNWITSIKKSDLDGLPRSTKIIVKGNLLTKLAVDPLNNQSLPRLPGRLVNGVHVNPWTFQLSYRPRDFNYEVLMENTRSYPFLDTWKKFDAQPFNVTLCRADDGTVNAVAKSRRDRAPDHCSIIDVSSKKLELNLSNMGLATFQRDWYKIRRSYFPKIQLHSNKITVITPELLNNLPKSVAIINLQGNMIGIIKKSVIDNKSLRILLLDNNLITTIEDGAFGSTELDSLTLSRNRLRSIDFARTLPSSIQELIVTDNEISEAGVNSFVNLRELKYLALNRNNLTYLPPEIFRSLRELRYLDLSDNSLTAIGPGTFQLEKLSVLKLNGNQIKELNPGLFKNMRMLETLQLRNNRIERIQGDSFSGIKNSTISEIDLGENEIGGIEEGSFAHMTIKKVALDHNRILEKSIAKGAFDSCLLSELSLSSNLLTSIDAEAFYGIMVYNHISLSGNNIKIVRRGAAKYMAGVQELQLQKNGVEHIESGAFYGFRKGPSANIILDGLVKSIEAGIFDDV